MHSCGTAFTIDYVTVRVTSKRSTFHLMIFEASIKSIIKPILNTKDEYL